MEANIHDKDKALRIVMKRMGERAEQVKLSDGFTDRLMERIRREERARKMALRRRRIGFAIGIAAALALLVGVALHVMHKDTQAPQQSEVKKPERQLAAVKTKKMEEPKEERMNKEEVSMREEVIMGKEVVMDEEKRTEEKRTAEIMEEENPLPPEMRPLQPEEKVDNRDVCWILIPNTPFALRYSLTWTSGKKEASMANVSAVECVTIEENDTVLIKSPSGEISKGLRYVYEGEKKENDFVYVRDGRLLTADVRIYYKKAFLNADGKTYSYVDALALLDYPTCSLCMNE